MFCFRVCRHKNPGEEDPRDAGEVRPGQQICTRRLLSIILLQMRNSHGEMREGVRQCDCAGAHGVRLRLR